MFGHYRLDGLLGAGGMGEVHRAWDTEQERVVALKVLPDTLSRDDEYRGRFRREARLASRLNDPHVVPIHRHGEIDGLLYLEMRLIDGEDLGTVLGTGPLPVGEATQLTTDVASALDAAHEAGLVHRDVKPSNVFLTRARPGAPRFAYLGDFGIARTLVSSSDAVRTASGTTMGTLAYMAPERFLGREADGRVDVYALTCVLYECLTGQAPFPGNELPTLMHGHLEVEPPLPSAHDPALRAFDAVVTRGMAKDPDDRFPTAGELAVAARTAAGTARHPVPAAGVPAVTGRGTGAPWTPSGPRTVAFPAPRAPRPSSIDIPRPVPRPATPPPVVHWNAPPPVPPVPVPAVPVVPVVEDGARTADRIGLVTVGVGVLLWLVGWFGAGQHTGTSALAVPVVAVAAGLVLGAVRWGMGRTGPSGAEAAATGLATAFLTQVLLTARLDGPPVAYVAVMSVLAALVPVGVAVSAVASGTVRGPDVGDGLVAAAFGIAVAVWFWRTATTAFATPALHAGVVLLVVAVAGTVAAVRAIAVRRRWVAGAGITFVAVAITLGTAWMWRGAGPVALALNVLLAVGLVAHLVALGAAFVRWARRPAV